MIFKKEHILFLLLLILVIIFFNKVLFFKESFCYRDIYRYYYPYKYFASESIRNCEIPLWNPYIFCGVPFIAALQSQVFYPLSIICYIFPFQLAFNLFYVIHYFLAALFMYFLAKKWGLSRISCVFSSIAFAFSGYMLSVLDMTSTLSSVIWLPLLVLILDIIKEKIKDKKGWGLQLILFAVIFGFLILGGEPTIAYLSFMFLFFYSFISFNKNQKKLIPKTLLILIFGIVLAVLFISVQLIPFFEYMLLSDRLADVPDLYKTGWSIPFSQLITFVIPHISGDITLQYVPWFDFTQQWLKSTYFGFLTILFVLIGIILNSQNKSRRWFLGIVILASVFLSLGHNTSIYKIFYSYLPGLKLIKHPAKFIFLAVFCISIASGCGLDYLIKLKKFNQQSLKKVLYSFISVFSPIFILFFLAPKIFFTHRYLAGEVDGIYIYKIILTSIIFFLMAIVLVLFHLKNMIKPKTTGYLAVIILIVDLFLNGYFINPTLKNDFYAAIPEYAKFLKSHKNNRILTVYEGSEHNYTYGRNFQDSMENGKMSLYPNLNIIYDIYNADGYESLIFKRHNDIFSIPKKFPSLRTGRFLSFLSVDYLVTFWKIQESPILKLKYEKYIKFYEFSRPLPRAYLSYDNVFCEDQFSSFSKLQDLVFAGDKKLDPFQNAVIDLNGERARQFEKFHYNRSIEPADIVFYSANSAVVRAESSSDCFLILTDTYYPGWKAYVDGKETKIYEANYLFRGVPLDKGSHIVKFVFSPFSYKIGLIITVFSLIGAFLFLLRELIRANYI